MATLENLQSDEVRSLRACRQPLRLQDIAAASVGVAEHGIVDLDGQPVLLPVLGVEALSDGLDSRSPDRDWVEVGAQIAT